MGKNGNSLDQRTFDKLRRLYIIGFSTIALSVVVSQILIRTHLKHQKSDSRIINIAGRQRMLSQKLAKDAISLLTITPREDGYILKEDLKKTLAIWQTSHYALQNGSDSLGLPNDNSNAVVSKFKVLNPIFDSINAASKAIVKKIESEPPQPLTSYVADIKKIREYEGDFLVQMDAIVNQYDKEAEKKVAWLGNLEWWLTALTLLILLGEFIYIFWPAAKSVRFTLAELLFAEKKAKQMAYDAEALNKSKENYIQEISALTRAMDNTLLFARIQPNGKLVHMGNKFSSLFKIPKFNDGAFFWDILSPIPQESAYIEGIIDKHKKIGWQGEVKATTKQGENVWLEMAIIPYTPTGNNSELLIIASGITDRKVAQLEIDRLTEERFNEKMNHQKVISSKIIENQEKEQNRIAKDVHDGIGQMLTGLKYNLESINPEHVEQTKTKVAHLKLLTENIIKGVRTATFNLTPPELTDHGIVPALTKLTQELSRLTGKEIVLFNKTDFNQRMDSLAEINIYRITQEAINNAIKYAESTHIIVSLSHSNKLLSIVIDDNGKGFNPSEIKHTKTGDGGMGLTFMKERIKYVNGRLFLTSNTGSGTRVTLNIPLDM